MTGENLRLIAEKYDAAMSSGSLGTYICVHGKQGTGKSNLLEKLSNTLLMRGANVFYTVNAGSSDDALKELLRQLIRMYGDNTDPKFSRFISSYAKGTLSEDFPISSVDTGNIRNLPYSKDSIIKFIYDCTQKDPLVFIIDDLDRADTFTIELFDRLIEINAISFLVISHTDKLTNTLLTGMLYRYTKRITYIELQTANVSVSTDFHSKHKDIGNIGSADYSSPSLDSSMLVLRKPGNERQLIKHYVKEASLLCRQLSFEKAALIYNDALAVSDRLSKSPDDVRIILSLLIRLGDVYTEIKNYSEAIILYEKALQTAKQHSLPEIRAEISVKLGYCCEKTGLSDKQREYIFLAEAFFILPEHRVRCYDLYKQHIKQYLYLLAGLDERAVFREKLKQAYSACNLDDNEFTCSLHCEEAFMYMESEDFDKAFNLLIEAENLTKELANTELRDKILSSMALCADHMEQTEKSLDILGRLISISHDPNVIAEATINAALVEYKCDGDSERAVSKIRTGIKLYTLTGADLIIKQLRESLMYSELRGAFSD